MLPVAANRWLRPPCCSCFVLHKLFLISLSLSSIVLAALAVVPVATSFYVRHCRYFDQKEETTLEDSPRNRQKT
ncbi:hypothetical protein HanHA300_Chr03g0096041 [Helianthus annuus]|nr:hypothetical protein HanHA300_Chr03g0096041 [Helianthus annuus]KAJ0608364.1 hypothetical protein HanHA89_Chr03g0107731 [Helianthus annuus]KAJ0768428.1 hypothetical protein HanLR1_Chr03g0101101 [Helianthus annuus]